MNILIQVSHAYVADAISIGRAVADTVDQMLGEKSVTLALLFLGELYCRACGYDVSAASAGNVCELLVDATPEEVFMRRTTIATVQHQHGSRGR